MADHSEQTSDITVEVERVTFRNDENGWTVLRARDQDSSQTLTAVGHFPQIHSGEILQLTGAWGSHQSYGPQFKVTRYAPARPTSKKAIQRYLSSGIIKGIGPKTAERIVAHFGTKTLTVLDSDPARLSEVSNIGKKRCDEVARAWTEQRAVHDVMLFLHEHGISPLFSHKIYKSYGQQAIAVVSESPYRLASDIHGIGFLTADRIAMSLGIAPDSLARIQAAILFQLSSAEDRGHCFLSRQQLESELQATLQLDTLVVSDRVQECLDYLNDLGVVLSQQVMTETGQESVYYLQELLVCELNLADQIAMRCRDKLNLDIDRLKSWLERYAEAAGTFLSSQQQQAVIASAQNKLFVLTGGPGVGKTTTANTIIRLLRAMGRTVALCAPTGRAAQRLSEVSSLPAKTIHRLLEWQPHEGAFARNEHNPLTVQTVICDEASMLDVRLADALLRSVPENAQLILIGDVDQLPSVGPGRVLADLIDSNQVPFVRLTEVFRQAATSKIIQTAHQINRGQPPEVDSDLQADCLFFSETSPAGIKDRILSLIQNVIVNQHGLDPLRELQILTPMNRGELGTHTLNQELQQFLNPKDPGVHEFKRGQFVLRPGDRVIQTSNNYELNVFNGDIGFVTHAMVDDAKVIVNFGERQVSYENDALLDLRLAYAITIHKSQGSEFPAVIIPVAMQHYIMLQRNLIYTALTRARKLAIFVGTEKALSYATKNLKSQHRQTCLIDRITQELNR